MTLNSYWAIGVKVFRRDALTTIGPGCVVRCLALAENLKKNRHQVAFICGIRELAAFTSL